MSSVAIVSAVWFTSTSWRRDQFAIQESDLPPYPRQLATSLILPVAYSGAIGSSVIRTGVSIKHGIAVDSSGAFMSAESFGKAVLKFVQPQMWAG